MLNPLVNYTHLIEGSSGVLCAVRETADAGLSHVWHGIRVKRTKSGFAPKAGAREILVRKAATRPVATLAA